MYIPFLLPSTLKELEYCMNCLFNVSLEELELLLLLFFVLHHHDLIICVWWKKLQYCVQNSIILLVLIFICKFMTCLQ